MRRKRTILGAWRVTSGHKETIPHTTSRIEGPHKYGEEVERRRERKRERERERERVRSDEVKEVEVGEVQPQNKFAA